VIDSDDEYSAPEPAPVSVPVIQPVVVVEEPVASVAVEDEAVEVKPKKKIIRKKTDA
jgi:hypothetical protein